MFANAQPFDVLDLRSMGLLALSRPVKGVRSKLPRYMFNHPSHHLWLRPRYQRHLRANMR